MRTKPLALAVCLCILSALSHPAAAQPLVGAESRVVVEHDGWELIGDLMLPAAAQPVPVVLMFNQAAGTRAPYKRLAVHLAARGIASLRLDLRGHGESINQGRFVPGEQRRDPYIWDAETDVIAAHQYIQADPRIDGDRIGMVGASYSGEEMAEAGRVATYADAYAVLSPGSFSEESVQAMDASGAPWLFITAKEDPFIEEIVAAVQAESQTTSVLLLPGRRHATNLLEEYPNLSEQIAVWMSQQLL